MSADDAAEVLVVGAGIGGLATALQLERVGIKSLVIESTPRFAPVGVGITILPHAAKQLRELGLGEALASGCILTRESAFFNRFGQLIYREPAGYEAGYEHPQYSIHRAHLHAVLLDAVRGRLGADSVRTGHHLVDLSVSPDGVTAAVQVQGAGPQEIESRALIGADGIHSVVRRKLFPAEGPPRYTGITMWRGTTVWPPFLSGATMVRAGWIATGQLVMYPIKDNVDGAGNQLLNWVVELRTDQRSDREWSRVGHLNDFIDKFSEWQFDWMDVPKMLAAADTILEYPMVDQEPLPWWSQGAVTLLGDAAHPMIPRGSNGAGQTILDSQSIADAMARHQGDFATALREYESDRLPATSSVVRANHEDSPDAILRMVYERTGDKPFDHIEDVVSPGELAGISENYKRIAAYATEQL